MSRLGIIDTHAHLDDGRFAADRQEVLERLGRDMEAVITQGTEFPVCGGTVRAIRFYLCGGGLASGGSGGDTG